jgi:hypothetical protein
MAASSSGRSCGLEPRSTIVSASKPVVDRTAAVPTTIMPVSVNLTGASKTAPEGGVFPILKTLGYAADSRVSAYFFSYSIGVS